MARKSRPAEKLEITYRKSSPDLEEVYTAMFGQAPAVAPANRPEPVPFPALESNAYSLEQPTPVAPTPVGSTPVDITPVEAIRVETTPVEITPVVTAGDSRRIHRATLVQDGHSHSEQLIYEILWRSARPGSDIEQYRVVQIPQSDLAGTVRMTTKNLRAALDRLAQKLSIEEMHSFDRGTRLARKWKVYSYKAILERRKKAGLEWVVRDKGVRFVKPETTPVETTRVVMAPADETTGVITTPSTPVAPAQTTGVKTTSVSLLGNSVRENSLENIPTSTAIAQALQQTVRHSDDDAVRLIILGCTHICADATEEEIVHFIQQHGPRFYQMKGLENPMGMLIRHLPKCFEGQSFQQYRRAEQQRREAAAAQEAQMKAQWQAILDSPNSNDEEREWARQLLGLEKS
jgi:hypothetical protein